ncbi:hypothetical protein D3C80_1450820 [compost metagenome]
MGLKLQPLRADFTDRAIEVFVRLFRRQILLLDAEHRCGEQVVAPWWLIFDAGFPLSALRRCQRPALLVGHGVRVERLRVADVGRNAVLEQVEHPCPGGEPGALITDLAVAVTVLFGHLHPVLAQPQ